MKNRRRVYVQQSPSPITSSITSPPALSLRLAVPSFWLRHADISTRGLLAGLAPVPIGSLKADFTNFPAGTKVTVGSILFGMLELPEEAAATAAAPGGSGEQLQTQAAASPAPAAANGATASKAKSKPKPKPKAAAAGGGGQEAGGDPFSRIEIKVGRITKVGQWFDGAETM